MIGVMGNFSISLTGCNAIEKGRLMHMDKFRKELEHLINSHSMENKSDTPDVILAQYLTDCLAAFDNATRMRDAWWGHKTWNRDDLLGADYVPGGEIRLDPPPTS
jgi:hypothetical protein